MLNQKNHYINSLDGLRALAVTLVLLFHVDLSLFKGGFIGVDIFFVISGFLITANILRDIEQKRWSFKAFYTKRIARLFPALFTVITVTALLSYFILTPDDLIRLSKSSLYAVLSISNIFFFNESGYFDSSAISKPLLHTWSLSVEEQFYIAWPTILLLLTHYKSRLILIIGIIALSIVSLIAAFAYNSDHSEMVFFLTPFRAYQFGLGALVAISGIALSNKQQISKTIVAVLSILGILALSTKITGKDNLAVIAMLPALGAAGFIIGAETKVIKRIFTSPVLVWIGQRSYSIYLVHWPLIVLWKMKYGPHFTANEKTMAILLSLVFGYILHLTIEQRFRLSASVSPQRKRLSLSVAASLCAITILLSILYSSNDGFPHRLPEDLVASASNLKPRWDDRQIHLRTGKCNMLIHTLGNQTINDYDKDTCLKPEAGKSSYLIIGDSFASGAYLLFNFAFPDIYFGQLTIPGCRLKVPETIDLKVCRDMYETVLSSAEVKNGYTGIIIASNWGYQNLQELETLVSYLQSYDKDLIMIGQRIRFDTKLPNIVLSSFSREEATRKSNVKILDMQRKLNSILRKKYSPTLKYVDIIDLQCPEQCDIFDSNGNIIYLDDSHFSTEGAKVIAARLRDRYPNLLLSQPH